MKRYSTTRKASVTLGIIITLVITATLIWIFWWGCRIAHGG